MDYGWLDYFVVGMFGGLVGLAELVSRYRDDPRRAAMAVPSYIYIAVNGLVSAAGLALIRGYSIAMDSRNPRLTQLLIAGFGMMALLRTSIFTVRIGNQDIGIGFSTIVQQLMRAIDSSVDRRRASARNRAASTIMEPVSFEKAYELLTAHCLALMQNLSNDDQIKLAREVEAIRKMKNATDIAKSRLLGLALINAVGEDVLSTAVNSLISEIRD